MNKLDRLKAEAREAFAEKLMAAFKAKFRRNLTTQFSIVELSMVSFPTNGKPFTPNQRAWVEGYEAGYHKSLELMRPACQEN